ncbi:hypothetical protein R0131_09675 [Clostridium sp. AL.422]|uniref:hypothetical protein n=1 Tax=Clostridium TaxID=1485 RepID=UPI00293DB716|nr:MULTISPECIES: hypothetical protein [unclassified Clostridium]MDV4151107.1 hypothetical protein [Clostridium sp. AL.422]
MRGIYPWLYVDYKESLWRFSVNDNKELNYRLMYTEGKWTKENLIDSRVTGFGLFVDDSEGIHLVYSNTKGELRYCTMKDNQWVGKVLYKVEDNDYNIECIKIEIIRSEMHIFYALASENGNDHGVLMHCIWDGHNTNIIKLQDIILKPSLKEYYLININNKNEIYLFYLSDEGDELSLNYSIYHSNNWTPSIRLYGIQGEEIYFDVELDNKSIHVLNRSRENLSYSLDHVIIDSRERFKYYRVYEGKNSIIEPLVFKDGNKVFACWMEENEIYYSVFIAEKWTYKTKYNRDNKIKIERCNAYISEVKEGRIKGKNIYATSGLDVYLYDPQKLVYSENKENNNVIINGNRVDLNNEETEVIKSELYRVKEENKELGDRIAHLTLLLQKNQQGIEKYNQQLARVVEQKRKAEENSNIFLELQKKIQGENEALIEEINILKEEKENFQNLVNTYINEIEALKNEIETINLELSKRDIMIEEYRKNEAKENEYIEEIQLFKEEVNNLTKELLIKDRKIQEEIHLKIALENQNNIIIEENLLIKKELTSLIEENKKINTELQIERNKSVMEKLLRKRT